MEWLEERNLLSGNTLATAVPLTWPAAGIIRVADVIDTATDVDLFALNLGQRDVVRLDIDAGSLGSGLDSYLRVFDSSGRQLAANDNLKGVDAGLTFQASSAGIYYIGVSASGNEQYDPAVLPAAAPADLGPNHGFYNLTVTRTATPAAEVADLVGSSFQVVQDSAVAGDTITVRYRVENRGAAATGPFTVDFRLSADNAFDGTDTALVVLTTSLPAAQGSIVGGSIRHNGLPGGASFSDEITFTWPTGAPTGTAFVGMRIDSAGQVTERNEANNGSTVRGSDWDALNLQVTFPIGQGDASLQNSVDSVAADFDGDGIVDLAYVNFTSGPIPHAGRFATLIILRGIGDGTFEEITGPLPASLGDFGISSLNAADFNGDGRTDLIISGPTKIHVLLANGVLPDGSFGFSDPLAATNPLGLALDFGATGVASGDFNIDGQMDLAVLPADGFAVSGQLLVYLGQGDGTFAAATTLSVSGTPTGPLAAGDFNRDGRLDLVSGSGHVFLGQNGGSFIQSVSTFTGGLGSILVGDFDNDGNLDLASGPPRSLLSNEISIRLGLGDGTFVTKQAIVVDGLIRGVTSGDFNGDGLLDLAAANDTGTISVLLGEGILGQAVFEPAIRFDSGSSDPFFSNTLTASDLNGDGRVDLALTQLDRELSPGAGTAVIRFRWYFGRGDGTYQVKPSARTAAPVSGALATGDFNRDGNVDVVTNGLSVLISQGDGTFADEVRYGDGSHVAVADFNNDGRLDFAGFTGDGITIYLGLGDGTFQVGSAFNTESGPTLSLLAVDFNGDGLTDLALDDDLYLAGPGMTFTKVATPLPGSVRLAGDFNGDQITDLIVNEDGRIALASDDGTGHGDGTFTLLDDAFQLLTPFATPPTYFTSSELSGYSELRLGDFDGDGILDIAAIAPPTSVVANLAILRGASDGTFTQIADSPSLGISDRYTLTTGDFNGDGLADVAVSFAQLFTSPSSGVSIFLSSVAPVTNELTLVGSSGFGAPPGNVAVAGADLNGDQRLDVVTLNQGPPAALSAALNRGDATFLNERQFVATTLQLRPIQADLDQDGTIDSVLLSQTGEIYFRRGRPGQAGSFDAPVLVNPGQPARDLVVVMQNGKPRLAVLSVQPGAGNQDSITLYDWNAATKSFDRLAGPASSLLPTRIQAGDVTDDGRADLVVLNGGSNIVQIFESSGSTFVAGPSLNLGNVPGLFTLANVDGIAGLDLIVGHPNSGEVQIIPILPGSVPDFGTPLVFRTGVGLYESVFGVGLVSSEITWSMKVGDFNRDALPDLVVTNRGANTFSLLLGRAGGTFSEPRAFATGSLPTEIVVGDFSRDGHLDVAVLNEADATVQVFLGDGLGGFFLGSTVAAGNVPKGLASADVNADGSLDLLIGNEFGDLLIILGNGNGTFRPFVRAQQNVPFVTTDINGDGVADVVLANQSVDQVLSQIRAAGTSDFSVGGFSQGSSQGVQAPGFVTLGNINNDAWTDFIVANSGSNNLLVYLGTGPGQFSSTAMSFFTGTNPVGVAVAQLNNDTLPDLAVVNQGSNDVTVLFGQGTGTAWTLTPGPRLDVGLGPNAIASGDFDRNGVPDLMVTNAQEATLWMLSGLGNGFFNDVNPPTLNMPAPIVQTNFNLGAGFALTSTGSIFTFNPFDFSQAALNVYNSPVNIQTTSFTFRPGTTDIFTGRGDGSIAALSQSGGQYADSLVFRDAQLTNPSALEVVGNELYVTNQGDSLPIVFGLNTVFPGGLGGDDFGSVTNLDSIDQARLSVIATALAGSSSDQDDDTAEDESGDELLIAGNNVGLLGSVSLLSLLFAQTNGVEETTDDPAADVSEAETPEWVEFVVGLQEAIDRFRAELRASNQDLAGIDMIDHSLERLGYWLADSARGLDGWLAALAPDPFDRSSSQVAPQAHGESGAPATISTATEMNLVEATAAPDAADLVGWWSAPRDWWSALTAAAVASCGWLGWRRRRASRQKPVPLSAPH